MASGSLPSSLGCLNICGRVGIWSVMEGIGVLFTEDELDFSLTP